MMISLKAVFRVDLKAMGFCLIGGWRIAFNWDMYRARLLAPSNCSHLGTVLNKTKCLALFQGHAEYDILSMSFETMVQPDSIMTEAAGSWHKDTRIQRCVHRDNGSQC